MGGQMMKEPRRENGDYPRLAMCPGLGVALRFGSFFFDGFVPIRCYYNLPLPLKRYSTMVAQSLNGWAHSYP